MAARQIIEVVQCRVADLKVGDVVRSQGGWFKIQDLTLLEGGRIFIQKSRAIGFTRDPGDLVDLQLTKTAYSNAPHTVDVHLPGDHRYEKGRGYEFQFPIDDEGDEIVVTVHRSSLDDAVVVDVDTPFQPHGEDGIDLRIMLNDDPIWKNGPSCEEQTSD